MQRYAGSPHQKEVVPRQSILSPNTLHTAYLEKNIEGSTVKEEMEAEKELCQQSGQLANSADQPGLGS
jgi:hypothetical protein